MIVRSARDRLQLITQPDHAHLARSIMEHCVGLATQPRRAAILRAIGDHDNGWAEEDAAPTVDLETRTIADFVNLPLRERHAVWPRGVARLADDPWAAALVAHHAITVYDRFRPDTAWTPFFAEMAAVRTAMLEASGVPPVSRKLDDLFADYPFVRLGDLISLTFCAGWTEVLRFAEWTVELVDTRVVVTPDPFGGETIPIEIAAREVPDQLYRSDAELHEALSRGTTKTLRGVVAGS